MVNLLLFCLSIVRGRLFSRFSVAAAANSIDIGGEICRSESSELHSGDPLTEQIVLHHLDLAANRADEMEMVILHKLIHSQCFRQEMLAQYVALAEKLHIVINSSPAHMIFLVKCIVEFIYIEMRTHAKHLREDCLPLGCLPHVPRLDVFVELIKRCFEMIVLHR